MSDNISPEERLFQAIRQGKGTAGQAPDGREQKTGGWVNRFKSFVASLTAGVQGACQKDAMLLRFKLPALEPENINKVLAVILGIVLMVAVAAALEKHKDIAVIEKAASRVRVSEEEGKSRIEPLKELSFYLGEVQKRDLFRLSLRENVQRPPETTGKAVEHLKLQGISFGEVPKAMILWQDGKDNKMYFLVEGQPIGTTGLKVTKISRSAVKVSDGKEETALL